MSRTLVYWQAGASVEMLDPFAGLCYSKRDCSLLIRDLDADGSDLAAPPGDEPWSNEAGENVGQRMPQPGMRGEDTWKRNN